MIVPEARGDNRFLTLSIFSKTGRGWGTKRTNPITKASASRRPAVYLYGKQASCPVSVGLTYYNRTRGMGGVPPVVRIISASTPS